LEILSADSAKTTPDVAKPIAAASAHAVFFKEIPLVSRTVMPQFSPADVLSNRGMPYSVASSVLHMTPGFGN